MHECLDDFPSVALPLNWAIELTPRLQPRHFSISSACLPALAPAASLHSNVHGNVHENVHENVCENVCELTVAVVSYKTPWRRSIEGLCSNYLRSLLGCSERVPVWVEKGSLHLGKFADISEQPQSALLIGPGTGIAPFKACVDHLVRSIGNAGCGSPHADTRLLVVFGCRGESSDYLHRSFWHDSVGKSPCFASPGGFAAAFSRDQRGELLTHASPGHVSTRSLRRDEGKMTGDTVPAYSIANKYYVQVCTHPFLSLLSLSLFHFLSKTLGYQGNVS